MASKKGEEKVRRAPGAIVELERLAKLCDVGSLMLLAAGPDARVRKLGVFEAFEHSDGGVVLRAEGKVPAGANELLVVLRKGKKEREVLLRSALKPDARAVVAIMRVRLTAGIAVSTQ